MPIVLYGCWSRQLRRPRLCFLLILSAAILVHLLINILRPEPISLFGKQSQRLSVDTKYPLKDGSNANRSRRLVVRESDVNNGDLIVVSWNLGSWIHISGTVILPPTVRSGDGGGARDRKCHFTEDRLAYNGSEAVLIFGDVMTYPKDFPPQGVARRQKWIYWSMESPGHTVHNGGRYMRLRHQVSSIIISFR